MKPYKPPIEERTGKVRLDFNENFSGCSSKVIKRLRRVTKDDISAYPKYKKFYKKLSGYLGVSEEEILLTNGGDEGIKIVADSFLGKCSEVILPTPTFGMYEFYCGLKKSKVKRIKYEKENLSFPIKKVLRNTTKKTKLIVLVNPNNPTGTIIEKEDIIKILEKGKDSIVLLDEAYYQFYGKSAIKLIKRFDNLIILRTFSKAYGLSGLRLGYIVSNKKKLKKLKKFASPYSVNYLSVIAGEIAIEDEKFIKNYVKENKENKEFLKTELEKIGIKVYPSFANFLLCDFGKKNKEIVEKLKRKNILIRDVSSDPMLKNCLRITIGRRKDLKLLLNELKKIISEPTILFDLDGTLIDVMKSYRVAIKKTTEFFTNEKIRDSEIQELKEDGNFNNDWIVTEELVKRRGMKIPKERIMKKFQKFYEKNRINEKLLIDKKILKSLSKKYKLGIITGRPKDEAVNALERFEIKKYFSSIITSNDLSKGKEKPDPYGINLAVEELNSELLKTIYIGDNIDDMISARKAGVKGVKVNSQFYKKMVKKWKDETRK